MLSGADGAKITRAALPHEAAPFSARRHYKEDWDERQEPQTMGRHVPSTCSGRV